MADRRLVLEWRRRWNVNLFHFLRRRVRSTVDAQDLAQETYLRLLRARDLSEVRNPLAYLLQVASHVALDWCERRPPELEPIEGLEDQILSEDLPPEFELDAALFQKRFDATLATLSPMMRAVLLLRLKERSHQQIASDLNISLRQVRRYLARGYERLRAAIED